jgi:hypothetical protein
MSDHLKRGSERDMEDGEVMEKFYHNVDYLRYMGIWTSNFGEPEGAMRYIKSIMPLKEPFERILREYVEATDHSLELNWVEDSVLKNLVKEFFSEYRYLADGIILSPNYLVFVFRRGNTCVMLVFGLTEEGRLFLNILESVEQTIEKKMVCTLGGIDVHISSDRAIARIFGFEGFARDGEVLSLPPNRGTFAYRLQGDIVADLLPVPRARKDLSPREFLFSMFEEPIRNYLELCVLDIVYSALLEHGFSVIPAGQSSALSAAPHAIGLIGVSADDFLKNHFVFESILRKYFHTTRIIIKHGGEYARAVITSNDFGVFCITFQHFEWVQQSRIEIRIRPERVDDSPMALKLKRELEAALPNMEKIPETSFRLGNHSITLTNFISNTVTFRPSYRPMFLDWPIEVTFVDIRDLRRMDVPVGVDELRDFRFISLPNAKITLKHVEHGTKTVYVKPYLAVRLQTTNVANNFITYRNRAVLYALAERFRAENKEQNPSWLDRARHTFIKAKKGLWSGFKPDTI